MKEARLFGSTRRRIAMVFAAILVGAGLVAVTAAPAHANVYTCPESTFCVWDTGGFEDWPDAQWYVGSGYGGYCINFPSYLNDKVDSAAITNGAYTRSATLYTDINCSGSPNYFLRTLTFGGPYAGSCHSSSSDNWGCGLPTFGALPSSVWIIRR
jgi:hypothetical protein